jgi:uncharacterized protein (TIGR02145 family)
MPTVTDWNKLVDHLGGANVAGGKLKETGTASWVSPNEGATDEVKFKALPGGFYNGNAYVGLGVAAHFWTATPATNPAYAQYFYINAYQALIQHYPQGDLNFGFSVRCIKN